MKIGIVTYELSAGGVSTFVLSLGKYFSSLGHDVEIITEQHRGVWYNQCESIGIRSDYINIGIFKWLPFGKFIHARRVGKKLLHKNFDIIILNHCIHAQLSAHLYNKNSKIISVIHNDNIGVYQVGTRNINNIDAVACVSLSTYKGSQKYAPIEKLHCIPNGIELPKIKPEIPKPIQDGINIIFVGRIYHPQKGVFFLPDIIKKCKGKTTQKFKVTIVGIGEDQPQLQKMIDSEKLNDYVHFTGLLSREDVYKLYFTHHIFLMPSFFEGLPLTLIESMACACVPVVSYLKDITDFCVNDKEEGCLVPIGDIEGFANILATLINQADLRETMSVNALKKATEHFSITRMGNDYLNLISTLKTNTMKGFNIKNYTWKDGIPDKAIQLKAYLKRKLK